MMRNLWLVVTLTLVVILALPVGMEAGARFTSPISEPTPTVVIDPTPTAGGRSDKPTAIVLSSFTCR